MKRFGSLSRPPASVVQRLSAERSLDDELVGAPEVHAHDEHAGDPGPRHDRVIGGLHQMQGAGLRGRHHRIPRWNRLPGEHGNRNAASEDQERLYCIIGHDRAKSAKCDVDAGRNGSHRDRDPYRHGRKQGLEDHRPGIKRAGRIDQHAGQQEHCGERKPRSTSEALFEILRGGVDASPQEHGKEEDSK